ncbi:MAG: DUF1330 domain-containing protein [Gammaproteobacteria bacterium]|nr:DUF1330 domain-containing protein [Gammaproteobacteria bacterium]
MAAYIIASYRVTNPEAFQAYPPAATPTLIAHGAEILAVDLNSEAVEGQPAPVTVVLKFQSKDAARAWYNSPEYQQAMPLRTDNSEGTMVLIDGFVAP